VKHTAAILLWCALGAQCSLGQPLNQIHAETCKVDQDKTITCVTRGSRLESGEGTNWGPWFTLTSSTPKAGFTVKRASGRIVASTSDQPHRCGVTSDKSPIAKEGPTKGYKSGESFWAQCYIAEEDATHVVLKVNLQGEAPPFPAGGEGKLYGSAELVVVYVPTSSTTSKN